MTYIVSLMSAISLIVFSLISPAQALGPNQASVDFDIAKDIIFDVGPKGCLLAHKVVKGEYLVTLKLMAANVKSPEQSNIILINGHNAYGPIGSMTVVHAQKTLRSAGESLKLHIEAQKLFNANDWENYDEVQTKAEEIDENADPRLKTLTITVDGSDFLTYVANNRAASEFPTPKTKNIIVRLENTPITNVDAEALVYDEATLKFEGSCQVILQAE